MSQTNRPSGWSILRMPRHGVMALVLCFLCAARVSAADQEPTPPATEKAIREAITRSLPLLEKGAKGSMEQRKQCFTCHNQGIPLFALFLAQERNFPVDQAHLREQVQFTTQFLAKNRDRYREGKGQGGQVDTAGYALWTLERSGGQADETTSAVVEYLLKYQADQPHWTSTSRRPPSEQSSFTTSFLAIRGLQAFGGDSHREQIVKRVAEVREWILKTKPEDHEDRVFRLRGLAACGADEAAVKAAATALTETQRADGGWSQLEELESDPYATATALVALVETRQLVVTSPNYQRGVAWLLQHQREDGSWYVKSRSKPFQTYFESGYPHGKDQFISIAAAGWATAALLHTLPKPAP